MKRILLTLSLSGILALTSAYGQLVTDTTRFSDSMWSMKKKKMVMDYLDLSEAEKASFWPIYENYSQAIRYIEMETFEILDTYHRMGGTMKTADVEKYAKRVLQNDLLLAKVRKQYYNKFSKALTPDIASSFMHFDDMMRMVLRIEAKSGAEEAAVARASLK
jgi:Spy/CpxP family protein refolding chaperone